MLWGCGSTQTRSIQQQTPSVVAGAHRISAENLAAELTRWEGQALLVTGTHGVLYETKQCAGDRLCDSEPSHFVLNGQSIVRILWGDGLRPEANKKIQVAGTLHCPEKAAGEWSGCALVKSRWVDSAGKPMSEAAIKSDVGAIRALPHSFWNRRVRLKGTRVTTSIGGNQCARTAAGCITHTFLSQHGSLPMQGPIPADWGSGANRTIEATVWLSHPQLLQTGIQLRRIRLVR